MEGGPSVRRTWLNISFGAFGAVGVLAGALPAYGHHSWPASYLEDRTISIEGNLVEFAYQNPHSWVHVTAPDSSGRMQKYGAEWANPSRLSQQGITRETLKPGDHVILTGSPARDSEYRLHLKRIERPADGWKWVGQFQPR
jgi:hypothetical protein